MTDDAQTSTTPEPQPGAAQAEAPTIEQLYQELDLPAAQPQQPSPPPQQAAQAPAPDDPNALYQWQLQQNAQLQNSIAKLTSQLTAEHERQQHQQAERDLDAAVQRVAKEAELGEETTKLVKYFLMEKAEKDPKVLAIWENRYAKPAAWEKALGVLASQARDEFAVRVDPQLTENQRAMDRSVQAQSSTAPPETPIQDRVMKMNDGEFSAFWSKLTGRGY